MLKSVRLAASVVGVTVLCSLGWSVISRKSKPAKEEIRVVSNVAWQRPEGMEEYLRTSRLVDLNSEIVMETTNRVIKDARTPREAAIKIFYFVRDEIKYKFVAIPLGKASTVVKTRTGQCTAKTVLIVAMLRAANIPARFHFADLRTEFVKGLESHLIYKIMPRTIGHAYAEVYLDDKWIKIDPIFDKELYDLIKKRAVGLGAADLPNPSIDWDGYHDVSITDSFLAEDFGVHASAEAELIKLTRRFGISLRGVLSVLLGGWWLSNRNLEKLRKRNHS